VVIWIVVAAAVIVVFWLWFQSPTLCRSCGLALPDELGYPGQKVGVCPQCGTRT
jgi:hypothetical protein